MSNHGRIENNTYRNMECYPASLDISRLSHLFFWWVNTVINTKQKLPLPNELESRHLYLELLEKEKVLNKIENLKQKVPLWKSIHSLIFYQFWLAGFYLLLNNILMLSSSMLIKHILRGLSESHHHQVFQLSFVVLFVSTAEAVLLQQFNHAIFTSSAKVVSVVKSKLYYACLKLRLSKLVPPRSTGELLNIQGKDAQSLREFIVFFHSIWSCPFLIIGTISLLVSLLGLVPGLVGALIYPLLVPIESYLRIVSKRFRKHTVKESDHRMNLIQEMIAGIRTVKLTNLSDVMHSKIKAIREVELKLLWRTLTIEIINNVVIQSATVMVTMATFLAYYLYLNKESISSEQAFTALVLIRTLGGPIKKLPECIAKYADAVVALTRVESIVKAAAEFGEGSDDAVDASPDNADEVVALQWRGVTAMRPPSTVVISNTSIAISGHGLYIVYGPNASGKTSLLLTALSELKLVEGSITIEPPHAAIAYCAHDSWVQNMSARANILMCGSSSSSSSSSSSAGFIDEDRYERVVNACALREDFNRWDAYDNTLLGERGTHVSGGQKARIALARALYSEAKVLLLDNILSGLDTDTAAHVFSEAILKESSRRLILMSSHNRHLLQFASGVVDVVDGTAKFKRQLPSKWDPSRGRAFSELDTEPVERGFTPTYIDNVSEMETIPDATRHGTNAYLLYFRACGGYLHLAILASVSTFVTTAYSDYLIAGWTDGSYSVSAYLTVYASISAALVLLHFVAEFLYSLASITASRTTHNELLTRILGAKMSFFSDTPSGHITSCFSSDFSMFDRAVADSFSPVTTAFLGILTSIGVFLMLSRYYILALLPLSFIYGYIHSRYRLASSVLKREDAETKSPLYSQFYETITGVEVIRGYRIESKLIDEHHKLLDAHLCAKLNWDAVNRWLGINLDIIGVLMIFGAVLCLSFSRNISGSLAGLLISHAMRITNNLKSVVRTSTGLENRFTAVERIFELIAVDQESTDTTPSPSTYVSPELIPKSGDSVFSAKQLVCRYADLSPPVINGIDLELFAGELTGVCGRTGSGKSSLALAMARCLENIQGKVTICGVNIFDIPLPAYRKLVQVFPQDAYILSGTVRDFLDPHAMFDDAKISTILKDLNSAIQNDPFQNVSLNMTVVGGGANLSAGQKQILALARASLAVEAKIVILDEITSNMDASVGKLAIQIVKDELLSRNIAVLLIAHVIQDILSCDNVIVMCAGEITERSRRSAQIVDDDLTKKTN